MAEPIAKCPRCGGWSGYSWQAAFVGAWGEEPKRLEVGEGAGKSYTWKNARCLDCGRRVPVEKANGTEPTEVSRG